MGLLNEQINKNKEINRQAYNVIFFDVDGVLNALNSKEKAPSGYTGVNYHRISILKEALKENDAIAVIISTWADEWNPEKLNDKDILYLVSKLYEQGIVIADKMQNSKSIKRGKEITE